MKAFVIIIVSILAGSVIAADWPQFHGPNRDNRSPDRGLLKQWPADGPTRLWETAGIGEGYSTVAIADNRIFITGAVKGECVITALDMSGRKLWTHTNGAAWKKSYPGTRSTPTVVGGLLYQLSGIGNLVCLKSDDGSLVWSKDIFEQFGGRNITWGLAESPLVVGNRVICTPGGEEVSMVAFDRMSGEVIWTCTEVGDKPGYASPILIEHEGLSQIVTGMSESIIGVRASDGKLLWRYPHKVYTDQNILTPLFHEGTLIISGCVRKGTTALELQVSGEDCSVADRWHNATLDNKHGGLVLVDGRLYGYAESQQRGKPWMSIEFATGDTVFQSAPVASSYKYRNGCLTYADGRFYLYADNGSLALAKPGVDGFEVTGRLRIEDPGKNPTWAFPVVFGGRLYLRYGDRLGVFDLTKTTGSDQR